MSGYVKTGQDGWRGFLDGKFSQIKFRRLAQVAQGLVKRAAMCRGPGFGIGGNVPVAFLVYDSG